MTNYDDYADLKLERQLCFPLYACSRSIINLYTPYFKPLGITYTQYLVFLVLWNNASINVGELGRKLHLDNGTLTPLLKKMQEKGYLNRQRSQDDERIVHVSLTEKGWALREQVKNIPEQINASIPLSDDETVTLYNLLYRVIDGMEK